MMIRCGLLVAVLLCVAHPPVSAAECSLQCAGECSHLKSHAMWDEVRASLPPQQPEKFKTNCGYVFINGVYLEPPYRVQLVDEKIVINGRQTSIGPLPLPDLPEDVDPSDVEERERLQRVLKRWPRIPMSVQQLTENNVLFLADDRDPVCFEFYCSGRSFLRGMIDPQHRARMVREEVPYQVPQADHEHWRQWVASYEPPGSLVRRATCDVHGYEDDLELGTLQAQTIQFCQSLNLSAFLLVIAAVGHLWASAPFPWRFFQGLRCWSASQRPLGLSLVFVFVLSALDLLWTIVMSQAGLMREANPLAQWLINDPVRLAAFKSLFTFGPIGIFAVLRHCRSAQVGAWWACLICTLLATRWLVYHTLDF